MHEHTIALKCMHGHALQRSLITLSLIIVLHAYDVTLKASQQKEQELLKKLDAAQRDLQEKDQKCSKLEDDIYDMQKMAASRDDYEQEQIEVQRKSE